MKHPRITGKTIFVSGGIGTIGSVLVEKIINDYSPKEIKILDINEGGLFEAMKCYAKKKNMTFLLGDVRDKEKTMWSLKDVDTVFHAAALKHVFLSEYSPFESVKTNVLGTQNMLEAALANKVETFINISTDKAANPTSTMGVSKLLTERLTVGANYFNGRSRTVFASVRFGNVLNSSGSVLPIFVNQLKEGGPLTITDKKMVRYFMTIEEAVRLIFQATKMAQGGEVFILKMPAMKILDLAEVLIKEYAAKYGQVAKKIKIKEIGMRPGENLYEKIVTKTEALQTLELKKMYILPFTIDYPDVSKKAVSRSYNYYKKLGGKPVSLRDVEPKKLLTKKQIKKLLTKVI